MVRGESDKREKSTYQKERSFLSQKLQDKEKKLGWGSEKVYEKMGRKVPRRLEKTEKKKKATGKTKEAVADGKGP